MNRYTSILSITAISLLINYCFNINSYVLIILICIGCIIILNINDSKTKLLLKKETQSLKNKIQTTTSDAHLKNKQLLTLISSIPFPMLLLDAKGKLVIYNSLLEEFRSNTYNDELTYLHNDYPHVMQECIKDAYILEKNFDKIIKINNIEYQSIAVPVTTNGIFSGCLVIFQDISKTLEGEKLQKRFIADASHELKTPIAAIKGMIEILNSKDFNDDLTRIDFLQQIEIETSRLNNLVQDLLSISRLSVDVPLLNRKNFNPCELLDNVCSSFELLSKQKNISFKKDYGCKDLVFADYAKLSQVFNNLISNAIKYSNGGTISISTYKDDNHYFISISDEGQGLTPSQVNKIFDRFYRVDSDRSRESGGSGLGLAIVKSIIDAHQGHIEVFSKINEGTTFKISLNN
ncbi:MAG: HAMP domain-containing sensor histidine kinase [Erysipelotrichaceae bacterium]